MMTWNIYKCCRCGWVWEMLAHATWFVPSPSCPHTCSGCGILVGNRKA